MNQYQQNQYSQNYQQNNNQKSHLKFIIVAIVILAALGVGSVMYLCWDYFAFQAIAFSYVNHF